MFFLAIRYNLSMSKKLQKIHFPLIIGVFTAFFIITLIGFFNHQSSLSIGRFLVTFIPICAAWLFTAPWFGLFEKDQISNTSVWWRVVWAVILSTPLALFVRALLLNSSVQVTFVLVMISTSIVAILIWRLILFFISKPKAVTQSQVE